MYKLIIRTGKSEREIEFVSSELAQLYRDYHLAFGEWNGDVKWVEQQHLTEKQKRFVVEEKIEIVDNKAVIFYKVSEGIELKIEEVDAKGIGELWEIFRKKRNFLLQSTDWTQIADCELGTEQKKEYRGYRSYLRTLPKLYDNSTIISAKVYSFEDWKKGKR
jgi:hypothetical protein